MDSPRQDDVSSSPHVEGPICVSAFSSVHTNVLVYCFFWIGDFYHCAPLFFFGTDDEPTDILATSSSMGTLIIGKYPLLELSIVIGSLDMPHKCPQFLNEHSTLLCSKTQAITAAQITATISATLSTTQACTMVNFDRFWSLLIAQKQSPAHYDQINTTPFHHYGQIMH